jgi:hypothetical protein
VLDRGYKDVFFRFLVKEKYRAANVYNAIRGVNINPDDIKFVTLEGAVGSPTNDVSFEIGNRIVVFMEQQTVFDKAMPIRMLAYLFFTISKYKQGNKWNKFPGPEFYVFGFGESESVLRLSDLMIEKTDFIELNVLSIKLDKNHSSVRKSEVLSGYCILVEKALEFKKSGFVEPEIHSRMAVEWCIENGILVDFLTTNYEEVVSMFQISMTQEERDELLIEKGIEKGIEQERLDSIKNMVRLGIPKNKIKEIYGVDDVYLDRALKMNFSSTPMNLTWAKD